MIGMAALAMLSGTVTFANAGSASLEQQLHDLMEQNKHLLQRIQRLEEQVASQGEKQAVVQEADEEKSFLQVINDHVELSGLVEVEAASWSVDDNGFFEDDDGSDVSLATVEIGLDVQLSDWSSGHLLLLYEEGEEDGHIIVDEGTITLGNLDKFPLYLTAGKMYVPFGSFESCMISDPLTLELGETNDTAVQIGFEAAGFYGSVYAFNGDINEEGENDDIDTFGANLGFAMEKDAIGLDVGVDYINNIGDTDGLGDHLADRTEEIDLALHGGGFVTTEVGIDGADEIDDYVDGLSLHAILAMGPFTLIGEYVAALDDFEVDEINFDNDGAEPEAWNVEAAFTTELFSRETTFALGYQGTDEALALGLPEDLYIGSVSMEIFDHTSLAFEYFHAEDYDTDDGGTDDDADVATVQLAVEF